MFNYAKHVSTKVTPQSQPIPGSGQVPNSAGGFSWEVDDWVKLDRFLILGTESGSYYASERELTLKSASSIERLIKADGLRVVSRIVEISHAGRAPKNDPAIFALALCLKQGNESTRRAAREAVPKVCRIGTHLFQFAEAVKQLGGWGRGTKRAFADWYLGQSFEQLGMNLVKYQSRNGWSHRDLLRKAHVKPKAPWQNAMFNWAVGKMDNNSALTESREALAPAVLGFELAKMLAKEDVNKKTVSTLAGLIKSYELPRECVPTEFLNEEEIWEALLYTGKHGMPLTAMIRNLGKMTNIGLTKPLSAATQFVCKKLRDGDALKAARVHPLQILMALATYRQGHGDRGQLSWKPTQQIVDALDDAFYGAFVNVEPTGKRFMIALDVSGSMSTGTIAGSPLTPREASAALALVTAKTEAQYMVAAFSQGFVHLDDFTSKLTLDKAVKMVSELPFDGTDCSLPMLAAIENKLAIDAFIVLTDSETWAGRVHPSQALRDYRQKSGIDAKLIVNGMVANDFSIADPNDRGMLDVCGFDSNVPAIMSDFIRS